MMKKTKIEIMDKTMIRNTSTEREYQGYFKILNNNFTDKDILNAIDNYNFGGYVNYSYDEKDKCHFTATVYID